MKTQAKIDRRKFLVMTAAMGGGMALGIAWPGAPTMAAEVAADPWLKGVYGDEVNAWIVIAPDDTTTIRVAYAEMGQGAMTSNAMMVCEELECDWSKVRVEYADANRDLRENNIYGSMNTTASSSFRLSRDLLQQAGASARERLKVAAATEWGVPVDAITVEKGVMTHVATGRKLRYGQVAAKAAAIKLTEEPKIKTHDQYTFIGTPTKRLEIPLKVTGQATYGIDVILPNMLYAAIKVSPTIGGKLKSYDFDAVKNRPGVHSAVKLTGLLALSYIHYEIPDGVAIVADNWWRAKQAVEDMPVEWDPGPHAQTDTDDLSRNFHALLDQPGNAISDLGDPDSVLQNAGSVIEGIYEIPHKAHAAMEPVNCTVQITPNRVDVWKGMQDALDIVKVAAAQAGVSTDNTYVHNCFIGGGFGGRGERGETIQAIEIAKTLGDRPVKLIWSRENDMRIDMLAPMAVSRFRAALGPDGTPAAVALSVVGNRYPDKDVLIGPQFKVVSEPQSARGLSELPYRIPNLQVVMHNPSDLMPGFSWRGSGAVNNVFIQECFIDELAHAAGQDPYHYRRALIEANATFLEHEIGSGPANRAAWLKVLDTVAKESGWGQTLPKGTGRGIAIDDRRTPTPRGVTVMAVVVQVTVSKKGELTLDRADVAMDVGYTTVNPLVVVNLIRGQVAWYFGAAMWQDITLKNGKVDQTNFDNYPMARMANMPRQIGAHLVTTDKWNGGVGDDVTMVASAVCNAIYAATGKRIRSLPIAKHNLSWT